MPYTNSKRPKDLYSALRTSRLSLPPTRSRLNDWVSAIVNSMALLVAKSTLEIAREGERDPRAAVRRGDPALPRQVAHLILPPELTVSEPDAEIVVALSKDRI